MKRQEMRKTATEAKLQAREWRQLRDDRMSITKSEIERAEKEMMNNRGGLTPTAIIDLVNKVQQERKQVEELEQDKKRYLSWTSRKDGQLLRAPLVGR